MKVNFYYFYIYNPLQLKSNNPHVSKTIKIRKRHSYVIDLFPFLISFLKQNDKLSKDTQSKEWIGYVIETNFKDVFSCCVNTKTCNNGTTLPSWYLVFYYVWISCEVDEVFLGQNKKKIKLLNGDGINCEVNVTN